MQLKKCRFCNAPLKHSFVDLHMSPLANSYLKEQSLLNMELFYPLHAYVCEHCFLVQLDVFQSPQEIFQEYSYFSSYSTSWLKHAENFVQMTIRRFNVTSSSLVIELGSNDGYLLQYFKDADVPVLGIEPAANVAREAARRGIETLATFFCKDTAEKLASQGKKADLLVGNNILAHVPEIVDFLAGMKVLLKSHGVITMEFPHLLRLIEEIQFDTIYHEHFFYLSLTTVEKIFQTAGLVLFDVDEIPTHGGSLRIYARHMEDKSKPVNSSVKQLLEKETACGLKDLHTYRAFEEKVIATKCNILEFFIQARRKGQKIAGYGAPAKGNTLLNYCGIKNDFLDYTVDRSPHKQGLFLPGTHIPIKSPDVISKTKPDYLFVLPWNLKEEIMEQMSFIREWGGRFCIPIPTLMIL